MFDIVWRYSFLRGEKVTLIIQRANKGVTLFGNKVMKDSPWGCEEKSKE